MSKKKSIVWLTIISALICFLAVFSVLPSFPVGIYDYKSPVSFIKLGLDLKGGVFVTFEAKTTKLDANGKEVAVEGIDSKLDGTALSLQKRLAGKGYTEAVVSVLDKGTAAPKIRVEIPDVSNTDEVFEILAKPAKLEIRLLSEDGVIVTDPTNIINANAFYDTGSSTYAVQLELNQQGQKDLSKKTENLQFGTDKIYFILDGTVISDAVVQGHITGKYSSITNLGDADAAQNLAVQINSGAYEVEFTDKPIEMRTISPKLGEDAITTTIISGGITLILIFIFMILIYGLFGVAASLALICYTILMILALAFLPFAQLTLPGIAGLILGIGMAVDSNIIIFERIKDDYRTSEKKTILTCTQSGFKKSLSAIIDSNITTLIGAIVLWIFATGPIQGFAITLTFSVVISLISSLFITRLFIKLIYPHQPLNNKLYKLKREEVESV